MHEENRFVFVACHFNMTRTIARMLHSICAQSYENWRLIITDDMSNIFSRTDSRAIVSKFIDLQPERRQWCVDDRIVWIENKEKRWETLNVLTMIREHCDDDDIVVRIDADDALIDVHALHAINQMYNETNCDALWTAHRWRDGDNITNMNISGPISDRGTIYEVPWVSSHMKTFRKHLLNDVSDENFKNQNGEWARRAGDQYVYLPALHRAHKKIYFPMVTYEYNCSLKPETFQTEDAKFQKAEAEFLRKRGFVE